MANEVLFSGGYVVLNPVAVNELLRGPTGPVVRNMLLRGEAVKQAARRLCPVSKPPPVSIPYRKPKLPPGQLRDSIVKRLVYVGKDVTVHVGSDKEYALYVHEGTAGHDIPSKTGPLVFWWDRTQRVMFLRFVQHPGTQPNRFLVKALPAAVL